MSKIAETEHPVHELIAQRWSPYAFDATRTVATDDLLALFEAARWAASSYNEQPWRFIVATKADPAEYGKVLSCLVEPNQQWAKNAPVLFLTIIHEHFERNGKPNGVALHDLGLAMGNLTLEATTRGLAVHQMGGILPDKAREIFNVPEGYKVATGVAVGYAADPVTLSDDLKKRETAPRSRKPLSDLLFEGNWGAAAKFLKG